ncbi:MAG: hypothetical protein AAGF96_12980 [Bacteroidota bacterium]
MKTLKTVLVTFSTLFILGCSSDDDSNTDDCGSFVWLDQVSDEGEAFAFAAAAFGQNATQSTCNSLVQASQQFIDALEAARDCVPSGERQQFQALLDEATAERDNLNCDQLTGN